LVAEVGVGVEYDAPSKGTPYQKVLGHHFAGRARPFTKFEGALKRAGLLDSGRVAVPGKLPSSTPSATCRRERSSSSCRFFVCSPEQGYSANETAAGRAKREKVRQRSRKGGGSDYLVKSANGKRIKRNYVEIGGKAYFVSRGRREAFGAARGGVAGCRTCRPGSGRRPAFTDLTSSRS
jgi:hypothetical protein